MIHWELEIVKMSRKNPYYHKLLVCALCFLIISILKQGYNHHYLLFQAKIKIDNNGVIYPTTFFREFYVFHFQRGKI